MSSLSEVFARPSAPFRQRAASLPPSSVVHFQVDPHLEEVLKFAASQGWSAKGFSALSINWVELRYSADGWKTTHVLRSTDVPSPYVSGFFFLAGVPCGTQLELAVHVGVLCRAPGDTAGYRERGSFWMNNRGHNYRQTTR
jgi:hypothetical protein